MAKNRITQKGNIPQRQNLGSGQLTTPQKGGKMNFLYQDITDKILNALKAGRLPWERQYTKKGVNLEMPQNYITRKPYNSINLLVLLLKPYETPYYLTWRQIEELGGTVKKGETGTIVTYWKFPNETRKATLVAQGINPAPLFRYYKVWNIEQTQGIQFKLPDPQQEAKNRQALQAPMMEAAINRMKNDGVTIINYCPKFPNYMWPDDRIAIPPITDFKTPESYYKTLFHELIHATGSPSRLNRSYFTNHGDRKERAFEELIAEIGTAFVLSALGINLSDRQDLLENITAYLQSWMELLQVDPTAIVRAATKAQKAANYILQHVIQTEEEDSVESCEG